MSFDYKTVPQSRRLELKSSASKVRGLSGDASRSFVEIGVVLGKIKPTMTPTVFWSWCKNECGIGYGSAYSHIKAAEMFAGNLKLAKLFDSTALRALLPAYVPQSVIDTFIEKASDGEYVSHAEVKKVVAKFCPKMKPHELREAVESAKSKLSDALSRLSKLDKQKFAGEIILFLSRDKL